MGNVIRMSVCALALCCLCPACAKADKSVDSNSEQMLYEGGTLEETMETTEECYEHISHLESGN